MEFKIDFTILKKSVSIFIVVFIFAGVALVGAYTVIDETERNLKQKQASLKQLKQKYKRTVSDQQLYDQYLVGFKEMERRGIVKGEKRLSWIESLQKINAKLKLPILKHKLAPQETVEEKKDNFNSVERFSTLTIKKTNMILTAGLFHELDLISIFDGLQNSEGMYTIRWCRLNLDVKQGVLSIKKENILAECVIEWFSIDIKENNESTN